MRNSLICLSYLSNVFKVLCQMIQFSKLHMGKLFLESWKITSMKDPQKNLGSSRRIVGIRWMYGVLEVRRRSRTRGTVAHHHTKPATNRELTQSVIKHSSYAYVYTSRDLMTHTLITVNWLRSNYELLHSELFGPIVHIVVDNIFENPSSCLSWYPTTSIAASKTIVLCSLLCSNTREMNTQNKR